MKGKNIRGSDKMGKDLIDRIIDLVEKNIEVMKIDKDVVAYVSNEGRQKIRKEMIEMIKKY